MPAGGEDGVLGVARTLTLLVLLGERARLDDTALRRPAAGARTTGTPEPDGVGRQAATTSSR
jgi:hypothetical protein